MVSFQYKPLSFRKTTRYPDVLQYHGNTKNTGISSTIRHLQGRQR